MFDDELLTVQELSDYLKIRKETTLKIINTNEIMATKVGRDWRIFKSEVIKYLGKNSSNKLEALHSKCMDAFDVILKDINSWTLSSNITHEELIGFLTATGEFKIEIKKYKKYCLHIFNAIMSDLKSCVILNKENNINGQLKLLRSILESTLDIINFSIYKKDYFKFLKAYYLRSQDIFAKKIDCDADDTDYQKALKKLFKSDFFDKHISYDNYDDFDEYKMRKYLTIKTKIELIEKSGEIDVPYSYDILFSGLSMYCHNNIFFLLENPLGNSNKKFVEKQIYQTVIQAFSCLYDILKNDLSNDDLDEFFEKALLEDFETIFNSQNTINYDTFDE